MVSRDLSPMSPNKKRYIGDTGVDMNSPGNESEIRRMDSHMTENNDNS